MDVVGAWMGTGIVEFNSEEPRRKTTEATRTGAGSVIPDSEVPPCSLWSADRASSRPMDPTVSPFGERVNEPPLSSPA
ncbi:hypothetical protein SERLA73DRAFT_176801 [Serpula lacrymans var. lacrymans S7.3]|uniref:Uncharacterized protein n=1 Tax=Serpula lacrymans var. lacrymans (strain S7.3) TaxID=936435 RepID=F8PQ30_SERL3|nr:hypothetical protein SERLA73DRAFT_176801 [Serpula lacrymans var. lacrymans S7.3]